ncbi:hypothetical protein niasHT_012695 [Heterodera trifolii]|uniref:Uncharacterized protein n=1 Tax=Heterodera trifolii TaxID=157864 RepID=A0ABD2L5T0_9BILA
MEASLSPSSTLLNPIIVSSLPPDTLGLTTNSGTPNSPPICTEPTHVTDISPSNCDHPPCSDNCPPPCTNLAKHTEHSPQIDTDINDASIMPKCPASPTFVVLVDDSAHPSVNIGPPEQMANTPTPVSPPVVSLSNPIQVITGVVGHTKGKQIHTFKPKCQITQSHPSRTPTVHSKLGHASLATHMHNHTSQTPARGQPMMVNRTRIMDSGRIEHLSSVKEWKEFAKLGKPVPLNQIRFTTPPPPCPIPPFLAVSSNSPIGATNTPPGVSRTANNFPNLVCVRLPLLPPHCHNIWSLSLHISPCTTIIESADPRDFPR